MKIVLISGGCDPCHSGHIQYIKSAKSLGDKLIVGLNSDEWLVRKKGRTFLPFDERKAILEAMSDVDEVRAFDDGDGSACSLIESVVTEYPSDTIIFANGGDRGKDDIPEITLLDKFSNLKFEFGVGGDDKKNSSSWILESWANPVTEKRWGKYRVLSDTKACKVKELIVSPGGCLSYQRHSYRSETWFVSEGYGKVIINHNKDIDHAYDKVVSLKKHDTLTIDSGTWHQLLNDSKTDPLNIIEIQYGEICTEEDIESE